jgi:hypothetical protein
MVLAVLAEQGKEHTQSIFETAVPANKYSHVTGQQMFVDIGIAVESQDKSGFE